MSQPGLSFNTRKALSVHLGEDAAREIVDTIQRLNDQVKQLERGKVDVMPIVRPLSAAASKQSRRRAA